MHAPLSIGFVLFPNVTQLDFTAPLQVLHRVPGGRTHIVARSREPVASDCGLPLVPTATFVDCPLLDVLCVPGGFGVVDAIADPETLAFVAWAAESATYVSSVCTGAFLLGAAGLLRGRKATTHWAYTGLLPLVGATHAPGRVVRDGNVFTGGGVTAGLDFALTIAAELAGDDAARAIQLAIEYDPAPPFDAGHPDRAPAEIRARLDARYAAPIASLACVLENLNA